MTYQPHREPGSASAGPRRASTVRTALRVLLGQDAVPSAGAGAQAVGADASHDGGQARPARLRLFGLSFLMLFVELALIRWTGAKIVYLSYFSNFVLLGSFLGIGVGFLRARYRVNLFPWAPVGLALLVLFVLKFPVQVNRSGNHLLFFTSVLHTTGLPSWVTLPVIFLATAVIMAMISEGVARTFVTFRPLDAYRLDILGSIAGIAAFSALSFIDAKPVVWGSVVAVMFALLYGKRAGVLQFAALAMLVGLLAAETLTSADLWSPYYRISLFKHGPNYLIDANGIPHQVMQPTAGRLGFYYLPYKQSPGNPLNNVMVIGAGSGNDVATALAEGARHVDAVEIDPEIYHLGKTLHPNHPYADPRVSVHITDGRAFLEQTTRKYDLILFALPDSLTLVSGQSSLRLESYLFTLQAVQAARAHLVPGDGVFAMYNYYRTRWLKDRLAGTMAAAFSHRPCATTSDGTLSMLTISVNPAAVHCTPWRRPTQVIPPASDDHPFVYLDGNTIPSMYLITLGLILLASLLSVRASAGPMRRMTGYLDLFFMGAAFLLLETKNVVQFALLFGTTWLVNALVFGGVLIAVLAAVETSRHVVIRRPALAYLALLAALLISWLVPQQTLLGLPPLPRFAAASALAFAPIFLANIVFSQRFRDTSDSATAFGANLLGAMVGGVLEYTSLIFGYRWLLILVAVLYGLAFATSRAGRRITGVPLPNRVTISQTAGQATS